ncbi:MAG TPA: ANTAR domain-containing protein [Firmicutes bacterium]|nr:ANTAR domain-containing protein [Bacillota bacterium]
MNEKILLVSASKKSGEALEQLLRRYSWTNIDLVYDGSDARRSILQVDYDIMIVNMPLKDEQGHGLALDIIQSTSLSVIAIVKAESYGLLASKLEPAGVLVCPKPFQQSDFLSAVRLAAAFRNRLKKYESENRKLQKKYEEQRVVSRAKCLLVEFEKMSEPEAHRYIEKMAMDKRSTKLEISNRLIALYKDDD